MKTIVYRATVVMVGIFAASIALTFCGGASAQGRTPEQSKATYQKVAANLETGGDFYWIGNIEGLIDRGVDLAATMVSAATATEPNAKKIKAALERVGPFLKRNGFYGAQAFGMSVVPRGNGLHSWKFILARESAAGATPLWRGLFGGAPRKLTILDYVPEDAAVVSAGNADPKLLWKILREGIKESGSTTITGEFEKGLEQVAEFLGVPVDTLIASFGDEQLLAVTLARDATVTIPMMDGKDPLVIAEPALLLITAVKDDCLVKLIEAQLAKTGMPVGTTLVDDVQVRFLALPVPLPVPFQIAFVKHGNYVILGSSTKVVSQAIAAARKKNGLLATSEFKKAFAGMPMANNGLQYMSPRFAQAWSKVEKRLFADASSDGRFMEIYAEVFGTRATDSSAFVYLNTPAGFTYQGVTTLSGRKLIGTIAALPFSLVAGIAAPSFIHARSTACQNSCINNLRMLDAAKEQSAMETNAKDGDAPVEQSVLQYIKGEKMPTCPQGGTYSLHSFGQPPTCSFPGHALQ